MRARGREGQSVKRRAQIRGQGARESDPRHPSSRAEPERRAGRKGERAGMASRGWARSPPAPAHPDEAVLGLDLLGAVEGVVDEAEPGALAPAECGPEAEEEDGVVVLDRVHLGQLVLQLGLPGGGRKGKLEVGRKGKGRGGESERADFGPRCAGCAGTR